MVSTGLSNTACGFAAAGKPVTRAVAPLRIPLNNLQGALVNKTELIDHIAEQADISKVSASRALDAMIDAVTTTLKNSGSVTLVGFGTFTVVKRAARTGRNPRTGGEINIAEAQVPKFKPGKALKDALN